MNTAEIHALCRIATAIIIQTPKATAAPTIPAVSAVSL